MWFHSFSTLSPSSRQPNRVNGVVGKIDNNLREVGLKLLRLFQTPSDETFTSNAPQEPGGILIAPDFTSQKPPATCSPVLPTTGCSLQCSISYLQSTALTPSLYSSTSSPSLAWIDEPLRHDKDALCVVPEPLSDPYHIRLNPPPTESDTLDSLRGSSERAAFAGLGPARRFSLSIPNTSRPDQWVQMKSSAMRPTKPWLLQRLYRRVMHASAGQIDQRYAPSHLSNPSDSSTLCSNMLSPLSTLLSSTDVSEQVTTTACLDFNVMPNHRKARGQPSPSSTQPPATRDTTPDDQSASYQTRYNASFAPVCAALICCL